jgi:peptidoglycan/LPS O-acetylase OafA/YrhL
LLWVAVAAVTLGGLMLKAQPVDWILVLLNVTTLFGFISPGSYINTGAWSIGNEMVYYALTPAFLALYDRKVLYGNVTVATTLAAGLYFGFEAISTKATLASQWHTYINPLNNLCFYGAGLALYYNAHKLSLNAPTSITLMIASTAVLAGYPVDGDLVNIVTGFDRIVFFLASTLMVLSFYKLTSTPPRWVSRPLAALGVATYGVYLLHPIVYQFIELCAKRLGWVNQPYAVIALTVALTIAVSLLLYERLEAPLIRLGKRLTTEPKASAHEGKLRSAGNT